MATLLLAEVASGRLARHHRPRAHRGASRSARRCMCWSPATTSAPPPRPPRKLAGVAKVLLADAPLYAHGLAETVAALMVALGARATTRSSRPSSPFGKNVLPRVAALLDVMQISDITGS